MKKSLIIPIAAALLLTAVICTAGCVNNTDPVVGEWIAEDDTSVSYAVFAANNTGAFIYGSEKSSSSETESGYSASSSSQTATVTFSWNVADPNKTYTLTFADGRAVTAVLDAQRGVMTIGGVEYEKMASELSGASRLRGLGDLGVEADGGYYYVGTHPADVVYRGDVVIEEKMTPRSKIDFDGPVDVDDLAGNTGAPKTVVTDE